MTSSKLALSLFWRTFALLLLLLLCGVFAWLQALRELNIEPRAVTASAQQMVTVVQLSGEVLRLSDRANRPATLTALAASRPLMVTVWVVVGLASCAALWSAIRARVAARARRVRRGEVLRVKNGGRCAIVMLSWAVTGWQTLGKTPTGRRR